MTNVGLKDRAARELRRDRITFAVTVVLIAALLVLGAALAGDQP